MNIKHHEVVEILYITEEELKALGRQLFLVNTRTHGDYEDKITMIYGKFYTKGDMIAFDSWVFGAMNTTVSLTKDDFDPYMVTGYIRFEETLTNE